MEKNFSYQAIPLAGLFFSSQKMLNLLPAIDDPLELSYPDGVVEEPLMIS